MRAARSVAEFVAERFLRQRPPLGPGDERQIAARSRRKSLLEHWQYWQSYWRIRFLSLTASHAIAHMLSPKTGGIAPTQASVEQHIKPNPLSCTNRPMLLIMENIILIPCLEAFAPRPRRSFDAGLRIVLDVSRLMRPTE